MVLVPSNLACSSNEGRSRKCLINDDKKVMRGKSSMQAPALTVDGMYHPGVFRTQSGELANLMLAPWPRFVGNQSWGSGETLTGADWRFGAPRGGRLPCP